MEPTLEELKQRYSEMETYELVNLHNTPTLTNIARKALAHELSIRNVDADIWVDEPESVSDENGEKSSFWWPNLNTEKGIKDAIYYGVAVAIWYAISNAFKTGYLIFTGESLVTGSVPSDEIIGRLVVNMFVICLSLFLAWRIGKKAGYISAIFLLLWVLLETGFKYILAPLNYHEPDDRLIILLSYLLNLNLLISIIILIFAIHGVRGTMKKRFFSNK